MIAEPDVVLTTYGILTAAYKTVSAPAFFRSVSAFSHELENVFIMFIWFYAHCYLLWTILIN